MRLAWILLAALLWTITPVAAQDVCTGILSYTGRDMTSEYRQNSIASDLYTQHCEGSSAKKDSKTSVGIEAVVKAIPIKFNYGGSTNEEKLNNFCKIYDSKRAEFSLQTMDQSTVVREALAAFNNCVSLSATGIFFSPKMGQTSIVVDVRRGSDDAFISGISYDNNLLECRLPPKAASAGNPAEPATIADKNTVRALDGNYVPLICDRKPQAGPSGEKLYPKAELTIGTSRGSFFLSVPTDAQLPEQWASELGNRMAALEAVNTKLAARTLVCDMQQVTVEGHYPQATAGIPAEIRGIYKLTGGGCMINSLPDTAHNGTVVQSRPTDDKTGWYCYAGDPPNISLTLKLTSYVIYCGIPQ